MILLKKQVKVLPLIPRVMNDNFEISNEVRKKVLEIAADMEYYPQAYVEGLTRERKIVLLFWYQLFLIIFYGSGIRYSGRNLR